MISGKKRAKTIQEGVEKTASSKQKKENFAKIFAKRKKSRSRWAAQKSGTLQIRAEIRTLVNSKATNAFIDDNVSPGLLSSDPIIRAVS